jgi:hypothetical protein
LRIFNMSENGNKKYITYRNYNDIRVRLIATLFALTRPDE